MFSRLKIRSTDDLSTRVIKGGMWIFTMRFVGRGLAVVRMIVLARLLAPEDFGLMGIALLSLATLETLSQTGFHAALIQKDTDVRGYLNTAWSISVLRGIFLFLLLWLLAPQISSFFNSENSVSIIRVAAISFLLTGSRNIGMVYLDKNLEMNKKALFELAAIVTNLSVALILAFIYKNVWALVWGDIAANSVRFVLSYYLHPYRPKFHVDKDKVRALFSFGQWVYLSGVLIFLVTKGDDFFVGKMLGAAALGYYQVAFMISNLPTTEISHVISSVTFPAYAKLQSDVGRVHDAYLKVLQVTVFTVMPFAGVLLVLSGELTNIFLGEKWLAIVPVMRVLAVGGLIRAIAATTGPLFHGLGIPAVDTFWQVIRLIVLICTIYPLSIHWGLNGVAMAVLLSISVSTAGFMIMLMNRINAGLLYIVKIMTGPLVSAIVLMTIIAGIKEKIQIDSFLLLFTVVAIGGSGYLLSSWLYDRLFNTSIIETLMSQILGFVDRNRSQ